MLFIKLFLNIPYCFSAIKIYRSNSKRILAEVLVNYIFIPQETATDLKVILRFYTSTLGPIHQGVNGDEWHSDVSCDEEPPLGSILRLFEVPSNGGDTLFASMYAAYDALSEAMKELLGKLSAMHDGGPNYIDRAKRAGIYDPTKVFPANPHPIIRTHPETGRKAIFVNKIFTQYIVDMPKDESRAILDFLFQHIAKPNFQCRFKWEKDSVAFWDNRCALHHAMWDYYPETRRGYRVTIKGDKPR